MNRVTLAVAGSRKTQSIVDACAGGAPGVRRLALTFTQTGQAELNGRLQQACAPGTSPEVMGWFTFLLRHCIRPYLPLRFPEQRLRGLNFDGEPVGGGTPRKRPDSSTLRAAHIDSISPSWPTTYP